MTDVQSSTFIPTTIITAGPSSSPSVLLDVEDDAFASESLWKRLQEEAFEALEDEPELKTLLNRTVLAPGVSSFEEAIAMTVCYRLLQTPCTVARTINSSPPLPSTTREPPVFCPNSLNEILRQALINPEDLELGHTMSEAVRHDIMAVLDRDPACDTLLEVVLFMKGFAALVCHRAARQKWVQAKARGRSRSLTALFLQSQASALFAVDIHPAATLGAGILLDHGTGVVIGETARVGDGCTLLHEVTLGGTGKDHGDRHPKIGAHVLIGAGAKILGNIKVGDRAKIGAGSIVLKSIPAGATAVGAPAKIIGRTLEADPARDGDQNLDHVGMLHKSASSVVLGSRADASTVTASVTSESNLDESNNDFTNRDDDDDDDNDNDENDAGENEKEDDHGEKQMKDEQEQPCKLNPRRFFRRMKKESREEMSFCPFRDYTRMAFRAPANSLTIVSLRNLLLPEGCDSDEIGGTFFELDTKNVGHVHWKAAKDKLGTALENNTKLSKDKIESIVQKLSKTKS